MPLRPPRQTRRRASRGPDYRVAPNEPRDHGWLSLSPKLDTLRRRSMAVELIDNERCRRAGHAAGSARRCGSNQLSIRASPIGRAQRCFSGEERPSVSVAARSKRRRLRTRRERPLRPMRVCGEAGKRAVGGTPASSRPAIGARPSDVLDRDRSQPSPANADQRYTRLGQSAEKYSLTVGCGAGSLAHAEAD